MSISPIVLVTGCTQGGIGFALCEEFAFKGCKVYATARRLESMEGFKYEGIERLALDVNDEDNMRQVVKTIIDAHGRIDIVVNNAGQICPGPIIDVPLTQVRKAFETNTFSAICMAQLVVPHMAERGKGVIINIGSVVGDTATPWNGIYSGTKAALHLINDALAYECRSLSDGIKVMLVAPGAVKSNISANAVVPFPENSLYKSFREIILKRVNASQGPSSYPAEDFARDVVAKALLPNPPLYLSVGGNSWFFALTRWLPKTWLHWYMFRTWGGR